MELDLAGMHQLAAGQGLILPNKAGKPIFALPQAGQFTLFLFHIWASVKSVYFNRPFPCA